MGIAVAHFRAVSLELSGNTRVQMGEKMVRQILLIIFHCKFFSVTQLQGFFTQLRVAEEYRQKIRTFGSN